MKPRFALLIALVLAAIAVTYAGRRFDITMSPSVVHGSLPPSSASYLGVYAVGSPPAYQPVANFAKAVGRRPNLVGYYSGWAEPFAASFARRIHSRGDIPYVQIDPTLATFSAIAPGHYDGYLRTYADSVRDFGHPVVIGFGHEMNGSWYSWGYKHVPAQEFVAAWRHIVTLFRGQGADNVTWLWTINAQNRPGTRPVRAWWPGARYVTWVGIDGYYYRPSDTFDHVFGHTIDKVRGFTSKPILLSETAIGHNAAQIAQITNLFSGMRQYRTLGLVWFDKAQHDGILGQDWRIQDNVGAEAAFRLGVAGLTLARP